MMPARDWEILRQMRKGFLNAQNGLADYWKTPAHLGLYDQFFAERIGWKWDAVLADLTSRAFEPNSNHVVDWGCGTGVATRRVLAQYPSITHVTLWDRSPLALRFATESIRQKFPNISFVPWNPSSPPRAIYLLSHVLNELPESDLTPLISLLTSQAESILWVEPGTFAASRRLIAVREKLRSSFSLLAPCPHDGMCGLLVPENAPHWCHHFTRPPGWAHHDPDFSAFVRELEIDMSTVPYSYLVCGKSPVNRPAEKVLGRPRFFKGHAKLLVCEPFVVTEKTVQKREDPAAFKALQKSV
ncbi:MAG: small ribosomal subunit Rsm22 family protein [Chthoniobacterales bacterium]